jgi:hypothetical protein
MKQPEYTEGSQAVENLEKIAIAIFQKAKPWGKEEEV